jgi:hypothetical protein
MAMPSSWTTVLIGLMPTTTCSTSPPTTSRLTTATSLPGVLKSPPSGTIALRTPFVSTT